MGLSKTLFPIPGNQLIDLSCGVEADSLEDVNQILVGINILQATADQQALDDGNMLCTRFCPAE